MTQNTFLSLLIFSVLSLSLFRFLSSPIPASLSLLSLFISLLFLISVTISTASYVTHQGVLTLEMLGESNTVALDISKTFSYIWHANFQSYFSAYRLQLFLFWVASFLSDRTIATCGDDLFLRQFQSILELSRVQFVYFHSLPSIHQWSTHRQIQNAHSYATNTILLFTLTLNDRATFILNPNITRQTCTEFMNNAFNRKQKRKS